MIIGTDEVDLNKVMKYKDSEEDMEAYIMSLIPERYKHVDAIYRNTRYYVNTCVLRSKKLTLDMKKQLSDMLTRNLRVVGFLGSFHTCAELELHVSMRRVNKYHEGELQNGKDN